MVNRVSTKRWPLSNPNRIKSNMNTRKMKRHRNYGTKTGNREPQQKYRLGTVSNELLGGGGLKLVLREQPHSQFLKWYNMHLREMLLIKTYLRKVIIPL